MRTTIPGIPKPGIGIPGIVLIAIVALSVHAAPQDWRGLALASFDEAWQTINDTYYDPTFGGLDWAGVRDTLRPEVERAATPDAARAIIRDMLSRLRQSHFSLLTAPPAGAPAGDAVVPIDVRAFQDGIVVTAVAPASSAERAGVRAGDRVLAIDGSRVAAMAASVIEPDARAARLALWRVAAGALRGQPDVPARLSLRSPDGRERTVAVPRVRESGDLVTLGNLPPLRVRTHAQRLRRPGNHDVGLIGFNVWMPAVAAPFAEAVDRYRDADGLVIDLRGNPGGLADMMRGLAGHLLDEPALIGRMKMRHVELEFRANPRRSTADGRRVEPFSGPVAILIDELTGSASECFAGGLQGLGRARVFGETSMGQALPAATRQLANGDVLMYAIGDFITVTGRRLERTGVVPDEIVPLSIERLAAGRDGVLDAALAWIDASGRTPVR
jgi:carboxyl-terminal processing protease